MTPSTPITQTREKAVKLVKSRMLINEDPATNNQTIWIERASILLEAIVNILVYERDKKGREFSLETVRQHLQLNKLLEKYTSVVSEKDKYLPLEGIEKYLTELLNFEKANVLATANQNEVVDISERTYEQHAYAVMQLSAKETVH